MKRSFEMTIDKQWMDRVGWRSIEVNISVAGWCSQHFEGGSWAMTNSTPGYLVDISGMQKLPT